MTDLSDLEALYLSALELAPAERAAFLDQACREAPELRARVERLLVAQAQAGQFLEPPDAATATFPPPADQAETSSYSGAEDDTGTIIVGKYKLIERIGEGGMGTVWMAQQTEPVKRVVAVKLIKAGMDSKMVLARFEAERQALALMDHPNIATVLDAGTTDSGRPFFVMELVKGIPITQFCDDRKLSPRQRLELFVPVCQAIQHAHQKGVIHRDIKPTNILVALFDGRPVPKVIDFGIAKATGQPLTDKTLMTGFGAVVGTPEYMAPEQAELNQLDIDTRADVYTLGVLLYELLTGSTPLTRQRLRRASLLEVLRLVREEDAPTPSSRLSTADALPTIAANRQTDPRRLTALVRGELDWVLMKALEKDRGRRYETANALARDIQRFLADEPVEAGRPTAGYRLRKILRRHRGRVAVVGLIFLAFIGGLIGLGVGAIQAIYARQADAARGEAVIASDQAQQARQAAEQARDDLAIQKKQADEARGAAEVARGAAEIAGENLRRERERLAAVEYGRTLQVSHQEWRDHNILTARRLLDDTRPDLRRWEWNYLHRLSHADLLTIRGHTGVVTSAAFSPDGTKVVTGSRDKTARIWDATTGILLLTLNGHTDSVTAAVFSADGKRVLTGSHDRTARIWDAATGESLLTLTGHSEAIMAVAFSPDGTKAVTGSGGKQTYPVIDLKTGRTNLTLGADIGLAPSGAFSRDGTIIAARGLDITGRIWDTTTGRQLHTLRGHSDIVTSVAFSSDSAKVVTGSRDKTARIWDTTTGDHLQALKGHTDGITAVAFDSRGAKVVTASIDQTARVWDAATGEVKLTIRGHAAMLWSACFSPDNSTILTGSWDQTARVWNAATGDPVMTLQGHTGSVLGAAFDRTGVRIVTAGGDATARVWDAANGVEQQTLSGHSRPVVVAAFSPDGTRIVTGSQDRTARVWDARTRQSLVTLQGHTGVILGVTFSPDGSHVVTASPDGTVRVWDALTGASISSSTLEGKLGNTFNFAFSPDATRVSAGTAASTVSIWDTATGKRTQTLAGHTASVHTVAFSRDGTKVVTGAHDHSIRVWDAATGTSLTVMRTRATSNIAAAFSPDGMRVVTGDAEGTGQVWDAVTGTELFVLRGHTDGIGAVTFSPDGSRVFTTSLDRTVRVWDATTGAELLALKGRTSIAGVTFSPDGTRVIGGGLGTTARIWDTNCLNREFLPRELAPAPRSRK